LNKYKQPLMPCHPARARKLLSRKQAAVYRRYPFTIILLKETTNFTQPVEFKVDPGSKTSGIALVANFESKGNVLIWAANLEHRGHRIKSDLDSRRSIRRSRRNRNTRYRAPRWTNRKREEGWIPPSLMSRVDNIVNLCFKLTKRTVITNIAVETVKFDLQSIQSGTQLYGTEYQQGTLQGYTIREYLLEKFNRACVYCGITGVPLEIEHIVPKSRGGTNRVSNLTLACHSCNICKGTKTASEFGYPNIQKLASMPLKDAAAVNTTRNRIGKELKVSKIPVEFTTGAQTKMNRIKQGLVKAHWIDAACTGNSGSNIVFPSTNMSILTIKAMGRGNRQVQLTDKYGFPRKTKNGLIQPRTVKRVHGFATGDIVKLTQPNHSIYAGVYVERITGIRKTGQLSIRFDGMVMDSSWRNFKIVQYNDGYSYQIN
jgi:5-methylcytosine-specific restriction endonuclease McrA